MAKKMNPGADATLVNVAYQSAMANTPANYSKTLQLAADSYEKTMQASSEMWGNVAKTVSIIGADMKANADELTAYTAKGNALNPEDAKMFYDEIYGIKDELSNLGTFSGKFGDRETRMKRAELKQKQQELFAEIDLAAESIKAGSDAVAAGLYDETLSPSQAEMTNAIIKSNLKNKITSQGNYAKLSRDEQTGELVYTLYKENGEKAVLNSQPQTMTIKQFNKNIKDNAKDTQNVMSTTLSKLENDIANAASKGKNGTIDEQTKQMTLNSLDNMLQTDTDIKRAMMSKYGYLNTSFYDDIQNPSTLSAGLYATLMNATGKTENGEIIPQGVLEGVKDLDGSGGISAEELKNADNYMVLSGNIVGMKDPNVSKELFKEYTANRMGEAHKYGYSKRQVKPTGAGGNIIIEGQNMKSSTFNSSYGPFINKLSKPEEGKKYSSPSGRKFIYKDGSYFKLEGINDYDKNEPLTFEDIAILDGWSNQVDIPDYIVGQRYERGGKTYEYNKDGRFTEIK